MPEQAVLFIIFNRPSTTKLVYEAIRAAKPSRLYIAADAPRTGNLVDEENCKAARAVTENIDWPCEVKRLYQEKKPGLQLWAKDSFQLVFCTGTGRYYPGR